MRDGFPDVLDGARVNSVTGADASAQGGPIVAVPGGLPQQRGPAPAAEAPLQLRRRTRIEGVDIDHLDEETAVATVMASVRVRRGGLLLTLNVDILRAIRRGGCHDVVQTAELVVADGAPLVWASRALGEPLHERVTGASLIHSLSAAAAAEGRRVMLVGGAEGSAARAADVLQRRHPELGEVPWHFPPFGFDAADADPAALDELLDAASAAQPDLVFVSLGFPRQERLAARLAERLPQAWFVGCGGALAMLAGDVDRAPVWMQESGLEWVHRMASEPRRLVRRYLVDDLPFAVGMLTRAALARRRRYTDAPTGAPITIELPESTSAARDAPVVGAPAER